MLRRPLSLGMLVALTLSAPAAGHGRSALFPPLSAAAGKDRHAQRVERRVRTIETSLVGAEHAAEHARQRAIALRALRRAPAAVRRAPDNDLAPQVGGVWAPSVGLPIVAINAVLMHTGKVLVFAYPYRPHVTQPDGTDSGPDTNAGDAYVFDPATGESKRVEPPVNPDTGKPAIIFCAGASSLPDGRILVAGGDVGDPTEVVNHGLNTVYTFDPVTEQWQEQQRMRQGRWYPSQLELPDGRTAILSGIPNDAGPGPADPDSNLGINTDIEVFSPDGTLQRIESLRLDRFDDGTNAMAQPATATEAPFPGQYPHVFWMPSGHALVAGPRKTDTWRFTPSAAGTDAWTWEDTPDLPAYREWAPGVLLPDSARVMLFGGADADDHHLPKDPANPIPAVASTTVFDDADPATGWVAGPSMKVARAFANSVQLPDGKVAVVGGGTGDDRSQAFYRWKFTDAQRAVDLFDPVANAFTLGNRQAEGRTYHSSAVLLPDGRVMSAGDDINGAGGPGTGAKTDTAEMWSPPYLFGSDGQAARRPQITAAPEAVGYGQSFMAQTGDEVTRAVLVAPGSSTHDTDMTQRVVPLAAPAKRSCGVALAAPATADLAPPGYYMLFLLDADGVPSKARFVRIGADASAPAASCAVPQPTATPSPTPGPTATPTPIPERLKLTVKTSKPRLRALRRNRPLRVTVTASRAASVRVTLQLGGRRLITPRTLQARGAKTVTLRLRVTAAGRRRLKGLKQAALRLRVTAVPGIGDPVTVTRRLRLKR